MTDADYAEQLKGLDATLRNIEVVLDLPRMRKDKAELEAAASEPILWDDPARAQQVTSKLSYVQAEINKVERLRGRLDDAGVLLELAQAEDDPDSLAEVGTEIIALRKAIDELEIRTLLSGEYDSREALVTIRSGAGGVDAADFAEMLLRMYLRWAERHGYADRGLRHVLRGGGRHQVGHLRGQGAVRVRDALRRAGHAPAGADQPVRQPGSPADQLRRGRGGAGGRADRRDRHSGRRDPGRRLPRRPAPVARASTRPTRRCG